MEFDLEKGRARMGVGELADFMSGPRGADSGSAGLWRAELGTEWHLRLRAEAAKADPGARFEVAVEGAIPSGGWTIVLNGRIDQLLRFEGSTKLREIKTVTRPLPADEAELRSRFPAYFIQLAAYAVLMRASGGEPPSACELLFVEAGSGISQAVALAGSDEALFRAKLAEVALFLDSRRRARAGRQTLTFQPAFGALRPGQESAGGDLEAAMAADGRALLFEAPTGFGKTGVLLEFALRRIRAGAFERVIYLTGKATGQILVARTLAAMCAPPSRGLSVWHVRNKREHCVNEVFHCVSEACRYIDRAEERWPASGLARFSLFENQARDLQTLRSAGRAASLCPYEITRHALAFSDVWIGDYNYVFSPSVRGLFDQQPGFDPAATLLLIDEAHNLPGRVAGIYSHSLSAEAAEEAGRALEGAGASAEVLAEWEAWARFLATLTTAPALDPDLEEGARGRLFDLAEMFSEPVVDFAALAPGSAEEIWRISTLAGQLETETVPLLWWSPGPSQLALTCLDAAPAIGAALGEFGGVVLATATPGPTAYVSAACGIPVTRVAADTPWRTGAYEVAVDVRVDSRFQQRSRHLATTAATVAALCASGRAGGPGSALAAFFPSYAYAESVAREMKAQECEVRVAIQPRQGDLASQTAWLERALAETDALFLVLGSSFAESVDILGGRVSTALVAGPALPEVNAVQNARMARSGEGEREEAFNRVYRIPGMQKVNQALGRLVRAPGQRARVLLHCRRFAEEAYAELLAPEYRNGRLIESDEDLAGWIRTGF